MTGLLATLSIHESFWLLNRDMGFPFADDSRLCCQRAVLQAALLSCVRSPLPEALRLQTPEPPPLPHIEHQPCRQSVSATCCRIVAAVVWLGSIPIYCV